MNEQAGDRTSTDWLLDLCVYAPLGLVLDAPKYLPELAEKGRGQVALARLIGKVAVDRMEKELGPFAAFIRAAAAWDPSSSCGPQGGRTGTETPAAASDPAQAGPASTAEQATSDPSADAPGPVEPGEAVAATAAPKARASASGRRTPPGGSGSAATAGKARTRRTRASATGAADAEQVPDEAQLPIDGYATLSASQIVPRLTTLAPAELGAVGRFERANRNRRTVLNRIDQLLAGR